MPLPDIVDSHCHLDFPDFEDEIPQVIARAREAGVTRMVTICTKLHQEPNVRRIAEGNPGVFYAAGIHPMSAANEPLTSVDELVGISKHPKMVGIGETGLDYHYTSETADIQKESLAIHIEAARQTGLPLIIHARGADEDIQEILTREHAASPFTCVMHCFTAGRELAEKSLELGFYLSISGIATFKNAADLREIFAAAPRDRLLVETDSPYLAPVPHRGKRNEPAYTANTAQAMAEYLELDYADFAALTSANFDRLFPKAAAWKDG
ncbi:TatD family hydrolase [Amaricoccus tamworthensis]|uniref:TatD family hydrolase n=1 Tax=Amaricoccus tamworthensis TaxID=57002 RepID=UPI003C7B94B7